MLYHNRTENPKQISITDMKPEKKILDACCGARMFWFDKNNENALYIDQRIVEPCIVGKERNGRKFEVGPYRVMDFRKMELESESFHLVVFDPPHLTSAGPKSYMAKKYGLLSKETWKSDLTDGFNECFRVLKTNGVLIFKWHEHNIPLKEVLKCAPADPLFGHKSGKQQKTHWICFMKLNNSN